jgi:2-haloacid dehalogenase
MKTEEEVSWFLENICTSAWNDEQDGGRSFEEATEILVKQHPEWEAPIRAWYGRWQETISGSIPGTVEILKELKGKNKFPLYALTNWSAQTFPWAFDTFEFLHWFDGIVVSGIENCRKPSAEFYQILFDRYNIDPASALFIDDNIRNIAGAKQVGLQTIRFTTPEQLRNDLIAMNII